MQGPADRSPELRISDADRHRVAEILREAAGDGRIDLSELDERLEATWAARTYADLAPITRDLPVGHPAPGSTGAVPSSVSSSVPSSASAVPAERHVAIMSGLDRKGVWTVPPELRILCVLGGAHLDLREATFSAREVVITINAFMGGAEIVVGPHTDVVLEGTAIMGGYAGPDRRHAEIGPDSPRVRVRGVAFWGGVSVTRKR
jgi:hypothetical protein